MTTQNAFTMARPCGVDAPAKAPRKTNHSKAPKEGSVHLLYDSNGRQTVSLERRPSGITIENPVGPKLIFCMISCSSFECV